jgi:CheY-like chemotaxis protein
MKMAKNVLIVDDDMGTVKYLSTLLQENGYSPHYACDGKEGMRKLKELKPDLLILDVMMPQKSGFVLFNQMKQDVELKDIPVIMLTSVGRVVDIDMKEEKKGDTFSEVKESFAEKLEKMVDSYRGKGKVRPEAFIDKPIEPEILINEVKRLIGSA